MNGKTGVVLSYDEDARRYVVQVGNGLSSRVVKVLQVNLAKLKLTGGDRLMKGMEYIKKAEDLGNAKAKAYIAKLLVVSKPAEV